MVAEGLDVRTQVAARPVGVMLSFSSTTTLLPDPTYRQMAASGAPLETRLRQLADPRSGPRYWPKRRPQDHGQWRGDDRGFTRMFRMTIRWTTSLAGGFDRREAARAGLDQRLTPMKCCWRTAAGGCSTCRCSTTPTAYGRGLWHDERVTHPLWPIRRRRHCGTISDGSFPTTTSACGPRAASRG